MRYTIATTVLAGMMVLAGAAGAQNATPSGKLVLYTSQPQADAQATITAFNRYYPNIQVDFFRDGTTQLMGKLSAEFRANAPQPDVLLIADAVSMEQLKAENRLMAYPKAPLAGIPADSHDPEMYYFGTKYITTGIIYNTKAKRPESWQDLLAPEAKGQVVMPSPLYSGAAAIHVGTLAATEGMGMAYYEALAKNGAVAVRGNGGVRQAVASGEKSYGVIVDFMALNAKKDGSPVDFVFPVEGVTSITEPVAILSTARNAEAAKAFVNFLLSKEGQQFAASQQGYLPLRSDVPAPATFPARDGIKVIAVPTQTIMKADEQNKRRFADLFGG